MHPLLTPRLLVTGPYPFSPYKVGEVVTPDDLGRIIIAKIEIAKKYGGYSCHTHFEQWETAKDTFPNLFRLCEWWEFRKESELPEYVKYNDNLEGFKTIGQVHKVFKYGKIEDASILFNKDHNMYALINSSSEAPKINLMWFNPATIEDYNNYIKGINP